jgi:hypothetical protein
VLLDGDGFRRALAIEVTQALASFIFAVQCFHHLGLFPYLARNTVFVLLRNIILLDFAVDGGDHGARQLNA